MRATIRRRGGIWIVLLGSAVLGIFRHRPDAERFAAHANRTGSEAAA